MFKGLSYKINYGKEAESLNGKFKCNLRSQFASSSWVGVCMERKCNGGLGLGGEHYIFLFSNI